jgi:hypothetical protein
LFSFAKVNNNSEITIKYGDDIFEIHPTFGAIEKSQ